jgi:uncharacterized protein YndB with AHSA1/START domain
MRKLPEGEAFFLTGVYREVRRPEKLVYTWRWESTPEHGESLVTVEFREEGKATEVVLTHAELPTEKSRQEHTQGWTGCLDRLGSYL